jgi:Mrp family chromosome partitioning ATPase
VADTIHHQDARKTIMVQVPHTQARSAAPDILRPPEIEITNHDLPDDGAPDRRLVLLREPDSPRSAAFRVLRHHLLERGQPRVIAVSSPREREGKTTCAINLALALAECGRARVLLVDGNLRRPEIAGVLRFVPPWCFAEQLNLHREQPTLPWSVVHMPRLWLHVAAINPSRDPGRLLDAPAFAIAMERLGQGPFDHIVIDCPSVLGGADVNLIQDAADGLLLVTRRVQSTARDVRQAIEQLTPAKVIGTALLD